MSTTFKNLQDEVQDIIDDASIITDVSTYVNRAIAYVSQFFQNKVISEFNPSQDGYYIDTPTRLNLQRGVYISVNDEFVDFLDDSDVEKIEKAKLDGVKRCYNVTSSKIYTTWEIKTTDDVRITYFQNYNDELSADGDVTDVPNIYLPLVVTCAVWLVYQKIVSSVLTNREKYPDVSVKEIKDVRDSIKDEFDDTLMNFQIKA